VKLLGTFPVVVLLAGCGAHTSVPKESATYRECKAVLGPVITAMHEFNASIAKGLTIDDYAKQGGIARAARFNALKDAKAHGGIGTRCRSLVARPLKDADDAYIDAYDVWNDCEARRPRCDPPRARNLTKIRKPWNRAAQDVTDARIGLGQLNSS
jgi:hypothetical protein